MRRRCIVMIREEEEEEGLTKKKGLVMMKIKMKMINKINSRKLQDVRRRQRLLLLRQQQKKKIQILLRHPLPPPPLILNNQLFQGLTQPPPSPPSPRPLHRPPTISSHPTPTTQACASTLPHSPRFIPPISCSHPIAERPCYATRRAVARHQDTWSCFRVE